MIQVMIFQASTNYGNLLIVLLTVDRFIAVRYPLKSALYLTPKRARRTVVLLLIVVLIYCSPNIFIAEVRY